MTPAERITKLSSLQTYLIIKFLVDTRLRGACFNAYAYFRWLDDEIDLHQKPKSFLERQRTIIERSYKNLPVGKLNAHESCVAELIATDRNKTSLLASFILNFFAIISFDYQRKHTKVSKAKLTWYTDTLAKAVTDGITYFIDHGVPNPASPHQYNAAKAAHILHMIRDYDEDIEEGYDNGHPSRTLARFYLQTGKAYIRTIPSFRRRLAASLYCARFERYL